VLLVLREVTVGYMVYGGLHVTEYLIPDAGVYEQWITLHGEYDALIIVYNYFYIIITSKLYFY